jgi:predicted RNase H-like HicB family nuclease
LGYGDFVPDRIGAVEPMRLTAIFMKVAEGYAAFIEELPGANTQGETLEEARENLREAVTLVLDANRELSRQAVRGADVIREKFIVPVA